MTKRKLKDWVIPTLGIIVLIGAVIVYYLVSNLLSYSVVPEDTYVTKALMDNSIPVQGEVPDKIIKPYTAETVSISKYYYENDDESTKQEKSLIKYENIYMPNTGILYSSDNEFDIVSVLDGKITSVKEDDILGNIIEIEHSNNLITIYQSVKDVTVKVGDTVSQGDIIAKSGSNKLENEKENCLHFETYKEGSILNPEDFFNLELNN